MLACRVCGELLLNFLYTFVLKESKPQPAVKVQEAAIKPEVTDKKLEKKISPPEETKTGIQIIILLCF